MRVNVKQKVNSLVGFYSVTSWMLSKVTSKMLASFLLQAILNGEEEIMAWLNYDSVPLNKVRSRENADKFNYSTN